MLKRFRILFVLLLIFPLIVSAESEQKNSDMVGDNVANVVEASTSTTLDIIEVSPVANEETARPLVVEPNIRVGLYKTKDIVIWQSDFSYRIFSGSEDMGTVESGNKVKLSYKNGVYKFASPDINFTSRESIRFIPDYLGAYFLLVNYNRQVKWKGKENFNVYRGIMEYKFSPRSAMPYIINELPLDQYTAGIGETSNGASLEYIKAILVAARSYAYFHLNDQVKDNKYVFDVYATTVDQLYLGYNSEVLMPRVAQAAQATYGQVVTYQTTPVVVPYFANSDGMTKLWSTVWGGKDKSWIQPVECIYDVGKKKYGHGVGMSAADAAARADKDGWTYDQLLKYYYTGVEVERIY